MEPMFEIPKDRKRLSVGRLCLLMGMTALLFIVLAHQFGMTTEVVALTQTP